MTTVPFIFYIAPNLDEDTNEALPKKMEIRKRDMLSFGTSGRRADDLREFVARKTGFEVRESSGLTSHSSSTLYQIVLLESKTTLYMLVASGLAVIFVVGFIAARNTDFILSRIRRKALWMTVSLVCVVSGAHCWSILMHQM